MDWIFKSFSSAEKGKKRGRSPSPEQEEGSEDEDEGTTEIVAPASPVRTRNTASATPIASPTGRSTARTPNTDRKLLPELTKYRSLSIFEERSTLAQKLAQAVPDADINSPRVIIVGGQTAGKTKLIISLVFYHLVDSTYFTDDMGEQLLKIFRTGTRMVTRRPTTIIFSKSSECKITLHLSGATAVYPSAEFAAIIDQIIHQSKDADGHAYEEELRVYISAPGLPNQSFTDLPGLTTKDKQLKGSVDKSIASLVKSYMRDENSTVVVVEPAIAAEDFETSQISPIMRDIRNRDRPDIFENSVLVLSKCDKIRDSLEYEVMEKIDLTSTQFKEFPYRHVVGVINKIEGQEESEDISFQEFKQMFRETKEYERQRFAEFLNRDGSPCNPTTQCTTSAVFNKMEQISFNMVYRSIQDGFYSIDQRIIEVERRIKAELAPPLAFYDYPDHEKPAMDTSGGSESDLELEPLPSVSDHLGAKGFTRMTLIEEFQFNWDRLLCKEYETLESFPDLTSKVIFIDDTLRGWPEHQHTSLTISKHQKRVLRKVEQIFHMFVDQDIKEATGTVLNNVDAGCFSKAASPFHRIDRFPALCHKIKHFISQRIDNALAHARKQVSGHLTHVWNNVVPSGLSKTQLCGLFDSLHHIAIRSMHDKITSLLHPKSCFGLEDSLFRENEWFTNLRRELQHRPFQLSKQKEVLSKCKRVSSNEELRGVLEGALKPLNAGDSAAAGVAVKMEENTSNGSSSSSSNGADVPQDGESDNVAHWLAFWTTAADEAKEKALEEEREEEQREIEKQRERERLSAQASQASNVSSASQQPTEDELLIAAAERAEEEFLSGSHSASPQTPAVQQQQQQQTPSRQSGAYAAEGPTFADLAAAARSSSSAYMSQGGSHSTSPYSRQSQNNTSPAAKRIKMEMDQNLVYAVASRVGTALFGTSASSYTTVPVPSSATPSSAAKSKHYARSPAEAVVDLTE